MAEAVGNLIAVVIVLFLMAGAGAVVLLALGVIGAGGLLGYSKYKDHNQN